MQAPRYLQRWIVLLSLVAFGLRAVWVPTHLAHELHLGEGLVGTFSALTDHDHHRGEHHDGDPEDSTENGDHAPHPAADHEQTFVSPPSHAGLVAVWALALGEPVVLRSELVFRLAIEPGAPVPRGRPPGPGRNRAPPSC